MKLTNEQLHFFDTFGFIKFPGLLKDDIGWITEEFEQVFPLFEESSKHSGEKRTVVVPFIDQRAKLSALLDDPRIHGISESLLGENFNYVTSDGNYYSGDTLWHPDSSIETGLHIKIAFYLDQLDGATGALRVIPGSHKNGPFRDNLLEMNKPPIGSEHVWGIHGSEVPAVVLDTTPGDVLIFNHRTYHSSWKGSKSRRMFTMNLCQAYPEEKLEEFKDLIVSYATYRRQNYYGPEMLNNAGPQRMKHLEQALSVSEGFYELSSYRKELTRIK